MNIVKSYRQPGMVIAKCGDCEWQSMVTNRENAARFADQHLASNHGEKAEATTCRFCKCWHSPDEDCPDAYDVALEKARARGHDV